MTLKGLNNSMAAIIQFESQVVTSLLHNYESWMEVTEEHIQQLQDIQKFKKSIRSTPNDTDKYC